MFETQEIAANSYFPRADRVVRPYGVKKEMHKNPNRNAIMQTIPVPMLFGTGIFVTILGR